MPSFNCRRSTHTGYCQKPSEADSERYFMEEEIRRRLRREMELKAQQRGLSLTL
jgi:hypothetical protein